MFPIDDGTPEQRVDRLLDAYTMPKFNMDAPAAFALLLGLGATTTTADPISAILFGAPGHAASAATALDGYPMTKRGEAGRALGASYMSALIGRRSAMCMRRRSSRTVLVPVSFSVNPLRGGSSVPGFVTHAWPSSADGSV